MDTFKIITEAHKGFAYLILLAGIIFIVALLATMFGYSGKISKLLRKSTLFTMILFHIQLIVGIFMLVFSPGLKGALETGTLMSNAAARFSYVEHPVSMLIGVVLMTIINKYMKTNETLAMKIVIMGLIAMALFAYAFPWVRVFPSMFA
ncbi:MULTISPECIES: hypothetical protein [unclassified Kaistella]|uniref:hypothetical protein n=1 Tax=unclassified Kaistella TaxID=2762626 RepID=UPI0027374FAC|nr:MULTISPECIES: hypothetical protein [unclassified Kaistella]MCZ2084289.1 hypothetical protein [Flavobacteriales bacterium]MDP2454971.1 hypothetical protein [Kaistella sp. SH11-4b]MDP2456046.1 hypothetical protein [Kaistella sp. SH40-3]MDP2460641.1 hypothetical protein [Kaistella sp. SH19-2b]